MSHPYNTSWVALLDVMRRAQYLAKCYNDTVREGYGAPMYFALAVPNVYAPIPLLQLLKKYPS